MERLNPVLCVKKAEGYSLLCILVRSKAPLLLVVLFGRTEIRFLLERLNKSGDTAVPSEWFRA